VPRGKSVCRVHGEARRACGRPAGLCPAGALDQTAAFFGAGTLLLIAALALLATATLVAAALSTTAISTDDAASARAADVADAGVADALDRLRWGWLRLDPSSWPADLGPIEFAGGSYSVTVAALSAADLPPQGERTSRASRKPFAAFRKLSDPC